MGHTMLVKCVSDYPAKRMIRDGKEWVKVVRIVMPTWKHVAERKMVMHEHKLLDNYDLF